MNSKARNPFQVSRCAVHHLLATLLSLFCCSLPTTQERPECVLAFLWLCCPENPVDQTFSIGIERQQVHSQYAGADTALHTISSNLNALKSRDVRQVLHVQPSQLSQYWTA